MLLLKYTDIIGCNRICSQLAFHSIQYRTGSAKATPTRATKVNVAQVI